MTVKENTVPLQQSKITKEEMFIEDKLVSNIKDQLLICLQP